ncbi:Bacteriophage lambda, GpL, minor tail [uncultured Caudovirales phage]|uniref:Bacteriophage lambda, GpL, minor tail n=1 Tax=uncultured Caudovirales phage TaxID=2100421 RepID=A0A6J5QHA8_9CAUD|nr:Bacteriophage lambda, GpL, minor tail [uncultured Caudovirales phage]
MTLRTDLRKLEVSNLITMYVLDPTALGGSIQRFHNDSKFDGSNIVWQGNTYTRYPVEAKGFEFTARGKMPRPTIQVSNVLGTIGVLLRAYNDLVGATLTRKRTLYKYLDGINFPTAEYLLLTGGVNNGASTPDSAAASVTGDIEIIAKLSMDDWTPASNSEILSKWHITGSQRAYDFRVSTAGKLQFRFSTTGSDTVTATASSVAVSFTDGSIGYVKVTRASGSGDVKYYTSPDGSSWSQLGTTVSTASGAMYDSTASVFVGRVSAGTPDNSELAGKIYTATVSNAIGGAAVVSFDARKANAGASTLVATTGETWTVASPGSLAGGYNPTADPAIYLPDDVYVIDRKASENKMSVTFELASSFDVGGVKLPRRQIIQNTCPWVYKSAECGWVSGAYYKLDDTSTGVAGEDACGHRLSSCKVRFGAAAELPYGGFPGAGLTS